MEKIYKNASCDAKRVMNGFKYLLLICGLFMAGNVWGQIAIPYSENFTGISAANGFPTVSGGAWTRSGTTTNQPTYIANQTSYNRSGNGDTKFISFNWSSGTRSYFVGPFSLTAGVSYTSSVLYKADGLTGFGPLELRWGTDATAGTHSNVIATVPSNITNLSFNTLTGNFTVSTSGNYFISIRSTQNGNPWYLTLDDFKLEVSPSCLSPSITSTSSISATSATINWTAPSTAPSNGYEWEVRTSGAGGSGATGLVSSGTNAAGVVTKNVTGLTANTSYTVYVRSNCGGSGFSTWSSGGAFTTPCNPITSLPWTEGFESLSSVSTTIFPACWLEGTGTNWRSQDVSTSSYNDPRTGTKYIGCNYSGTNDRIWTPGFQLTAGVSYDFSAFFVGDGYAGWTGDIVQNTAQSAIGETVLGASFITSSTTSTSGTNYAQIKRTFVPSTTGVFYFGIRITSTFAPYSSMSFDDFALELTPSCFPPVLTAATSISTNSASINWNAASPAPSSGYIYEVRTTGVAGSGSSGLVASGTSAAGILTANVSGLSPLTNYNVYVRSFCGGTDTSAWSTAGTFTTLSIQSASTGDWNVGSTWVGGVVPNCESAMIMPGHNVTVNSAGNTSKNLIIRTGGTLTVASGGLTVGCTNNNSYLADTGTLEVTGGILNINGNLHINAGATFNQSGGDINIDGNAAGNTSNSVLTGTNLLRINSNLLGLTSGKITIVDPHAGTSTSDYAIGYNTSGLHYACGLGHTFQFGNGSSTDPGGHINGFYNYLYVGTGYLSLGNVIVNSASGTNRHVNNTSSVGILGDLTITQGEFRTGTSTVYLAGNLSNSGIMTTDGTLAFATWTGGSASSASLAQTVNGSGTFRNNTASPTANFNSINIMNSSTTGVTFDAINNLSGAAGFSGASVLSSITFNGKATTASGNALLWGTSTARGTGTFSVTSGGMTNGSTFAIGTTTAQTGTTISSGADPTSTLGRYPFVNSLGQNRSIYLQRVSPTGTGITAFTFNEVSGTTSIGITDGSYTMDTRSNDNFVFNSYGTSPNATSYNLAITAPAIFGSSPSSAVARIVQSSNIIGTFQAGTVIPTAQRTGLTLSDLGSGEFYMGIHSDDIPFVSVMSGVWEDPAVWNKGTIPSCSDNVTIGSTHTVTSSIASNVTKNLTINSGGTLVVDNGDLTVGCTNNNNTLTNNGTLTVSGGTLNVNGSLNHNAGATFNQSGGDINIDGNSGSTSTSATSYHLNLANAVNWTGGTLTIVDPHASATATDVLYYNTAISSNISSLHTLKFGDGASTQAGGNVIGFRANTYVSSGRINYGNLIINGGTGTNRIVTGGSWTNVILGDLTINSNSEFAPAQTVSVAGNIVNNGVFTQTSTTALQGFAGTTSSASTNTQTIGGSGTYRNASTSPTANIASLTINNSNATGVTLNVPISISGTLTMTAGIINTTSTNILRLGTTTFAGTLSGTSSATNFINGPFARTFASGRTSSAFGTTTLFPVGVVGATPTLMSMDINPVTNATGPVIFTVQADNSMSGSAGSGVSNLANVSWSAVPDNTANLTSAQVRLNRADVSVTSSSKLLYASNNTDPFEGTPGGSSSSLGASISGSIQIMTSDYKNYFSYGDLVVCTAPGDQASNFIASNKTTTSFTANFDPASSNPTGYLVVRYTSAQLSAVTNPVDGTLYASGSALGGTVVGNYYTAPFTFNQTSLTANTAYTYKIYSFNNTGCAGPAYNATSYDETITTCATSYVAPTSISASNISTTSMDVNYTASTSAGVQDHFMDVALNSTFTNFVSGYQNISLGIPVNAGAQVFSLSGLNASTTYFVRIKAVDGAGCESSYSTTLTQATDCNAETLPTAIQNFSTFTGTAPNPLCWSEKTGTLAASSTLSGSTSAWLNKSSGFANISSANMGASINLYSTKNDWIISQPIDLGNSSGNYRMRYKYAVTSYNGTTAQTTLSTHKVDIVISTNGGQTWSNANILKSYTGSGTYSNTGLEETIDLSAYTGLIKIAFVATTTATTPDIDFHIDDFIVEQTPAPTITAVTSSNACGGNTKIVITGTDLNNISSATIGSQSLLPFDSTSSTRLVKTIASPLNGTTSITNNIATATNATNITFTNAPALSVDSNNFALCNGSSATVNVTSTLADYTSYSWSPATGVSGTTSATFNPTATTTYTLSVTNSGTGCSNMLTRTVTVDALPSTITLSQGRTTAKCFSDLDSLVVSGGLVSGSSGKIGTGTSTNTTSTPFRRFYGGTKTQSLYTPTELTALGLVSGSEISSIGWVALSGTPAAMSNMSVKIGLLSSTLSSTSFATSPSNTVFSSASYTPSSGIGNLDFPLTTNLIWDGTSHLLVETCHNDGDGGLASSNNISIESSTVASGLITYNSLDNDLTTCNATTGTTSTTRPNLRISFSRPATYSWSPTTGLFTNRAMTTAYTGTSVNKVYARPSATQKYYLTATNGACTRRDSIVDSIKNATSLVTLATSNASGAVEQCTDANGWSYYATAAKPDEWLFGIYKNGNTFTATVDINVDNTNKYQKSTSSNGANQEHASYIMSRYWNANITSGSIASNSSVKVRFFIDPQDITDLLDERDDDYDVLKNTTNTGTFAVKSGFEWFKTVSATYSPTNWNGNTHSGSIVKLTEDAVATLNGQTYVELSGITSFSGGSGGAAFGPTSNGLFNNAGVVGLPVTWHKVDVQTLENGNEVVWSTSSEQNTSHFEVEYSEDAVQFYNASENISAAGNSSITQQYQFLHENEVRPWLYYRIKQVDLDGKVDYSKIVIAKRATKLPDFKVAIYPIPLIEGELKLDIHSIAQTEIQIRVIDLLGKEVYREKIASKGYRTMHQLQLDHLPKGQYQIQVDNSVFSHQQRLVLLK